MYAWYHQIHSPTGIEQSIYCNFTNKNEKDLIVSAASQLIIYRLKRNVEVIGKGDSNEETPSEKDKLEQLGSWQLFGNVVSLKSVRLFGADRDSLLLSFREAKLSLVDFDVSTHDIKTTSLHFFEENIEKNGLVQRTTLPRISVDPDGRCASLQLSHNAVAIVPFRAKDVSLATEDNPTATDTAVTANKKTTIPSSYSIDLHEVDGRLQRIIDIQFLHGYYEPTLLVLFESLRTWAGRVAVRQDSCNIVAISLNMTERLHPVIWSLNALPFDCKYAYAVPRPTGGVLIFTVNSLLYLNQSVPAYGASLNSLTKDSTSFPLKAQSGVCMTLDCSHAAFISPESLVISLKGGELYVLTLVVDSMRSVRSFHFDKAASSVLTSSITTLDDGYIFLGSRLGNSLLLRYTEAKSDSNNTSRNNPTESDEPASKRQRLNTAADWTAGDPGNDVDDLDVYGREAVALDSVSSYNFEVCDSLLNIGPCGSSELGEPPSLSEEFASQREADLELVILSGHGKNGAISVLQRTVKPQIVTTFELPGCSKMWTVHSKPKKTLSSGSKDSTNQHGYLILSREDSTLILETGSEIMEVDESGFSVRQPTVYVGNIGRGRDLILQVCTNGVRLLEGILLLQHIPIDLGSPIVQCSVTDVHAMLLTADGQFVMLTLQDANNEQGVNLHCFNPSLPQAPQTRCVCLFTDVSGLFTAGNPHKNSTATDDSPSRDDSKANENQNNLARNPNDSSLSGFKTNTITADEEDELLYGESDSNLLLAQINPPAPQIVEKESPKEEEQPKQPDMIQTTYWAALVRENGCLEIYDLKNLSLVYYVKNFTNGPKLLIDSSMSRAYTGDYDRQSDPRYSDNPQCLELLFIGLGYKKSRPYIMARVEEELLIYEAFSYSALDVLSQKSSLQIRFKKIGHDIVIRRMPGSYDPQAEKLNFLRQTNLRPFENIGGYSGVFLCGPYPHWIFSSVRGALNCHPMTVDGPVVCFDSFHNVNCPHGFLYFNQQAELRICMLPLQMNYEHTWPSKKISLRCTPHFIAYSIEHKVYALVTSVSEPLKELPFLNCDNEREFEKLDTKPDRFVLPHIDKFTVQLISPVGWEMVPNTQIEMDEYEHVTCMKNVWLKPGADSSVRHNYVVMGTCNIMGEEMSSRGRIIILEVIEVVPEPGQPLTRSKLKKVYSEEQKGPVTSVCGVEGNLLAAIGQKVFIWRFDENQSLRGVAFVDTNVYIHHALSFRSFAIVADIQRSVTLLRYQEDFKTLSVTSRDIRPMEVYTVDLVVDGTALGFLASDQDKNLVLFVYDPEARESFGGSRLMRRADIHIGSHVNCMWRIGANLYDRASGRTNDNYSAAQVTMMGTLDGSISNMLPISEKIYRRLLMLQNIMATGMQHVAGLNPKAFRLIRSHSKCLANPAKNVLDGDLLWKFKDFSHTERHEMARKIGTTPDQILDDLMNIQRAVTVM